MALIVCKDCGAQISDSVASCPRCGCPIPKPMAQAPMTNNYGYDKNICPETHLVKAILFTIFCCWPLGIPAIVNAAGVSSAFNSGNYQLALRKSNEADKWCKYCLIGGIIFWVIEIIFCIISFFLGLGTLDLFY